MSRRLRICYVVPAHGFLSTGGPTRNVLSLARALAAWADVTFAFRSLLDDRPPADIELLEIQPGNGQAGAVDDSAMRGMGYGEFVGYLRDVGRFVERHAGRFDVILEKTWLLSGRLSSIARGRGLVGVPIENFVPNPARARSEGMGKYLRIAASRWLSARYLRRCPLVIAETPYLRTALVAHCGLREEQVEVVGLGIDKTMFRPGDQVEARAKVGIDPTKTVLLYSGVLDATHNLLPLLEAMAGIRDPALELHILGDGMRRSAYEALAAEAGSEVVLHGRVDHALIPTFITAADLCLAPYDPEAFPTGVLGYSTMKVPEYLSTGRAVASVPSGRVAELVEDGKEGFLFVNTAAEWQRFLEHMPPRQRLLEMGEAAAQVRLMDWHDTARAYLDLIERQVTAGSRGAGS